MPPTRFATIKLFPFLRFRVRVRARFRAMVRVGVGGIAARRHNDSYAPGKMAWQGKEKQIYILYSVQIVSILDQTVIQVCKLILLEVTNLGPIVHSTSLHGFDSYELTTCSSNVLNSTNFGFLRFTAMWLNSCIDLHIYFFFLNPLSCYFQLAVLKILQHLDVF